MPKEKVKEPWRKQPKSKPKKESKKRKEKLKKKGVGTFELDRPIEKDENDKQWNFGVSFCFRLLFLRIFNFQGFTREGFEAS